MAAVRDAGGGEPPQRPLLASAVALCAGAASVLSFSPFDIFPLAFVSLAVLAFLLDRAGRPRDGFIIGFAWGLGLFLAGVSWLYIALNRYGGVPMPVAALAILLFCGYLALYPALVGGVFAHLKRGGAASRAALFAALWLISEGLRGWVFTGFPWLAMGYSQTPPSPLSGFLPVIGVYGVGGLLAFLAALPVMVSWRDTPRLAGAGGAMAGIMLAGFGLAQIAWTSPSGEPVRIALAQTNIAQDLKWRPERLRDWLDLNLRLTEGQDADIVVLPEATLPMLAEHLPDGYLELLAERARASGSDLVLGLMMSDASGRVFNAAASLGQSVPQTYAKRHLVPFGEYSPPLFGWFYRIASIPMSDQTSGPAAQRPMALGAQRVAVNICYEDLFGRELLSALPEATLMLNLSNLAWYGHSLAQPQHLQVARVRALETGRPMLRSTNTGMTALVLPDGSVAAALPQFERGVLKVEVTGYGGMTPYARWGDLLAFALAGLILAAGFMRRRRV